MDYKKYILIIALLTCVSLIPVSANNISEYESATIKFEPALTRPNNIDQMIQLKCSLALNESLISNQTVKFAVIYENNYGILEAPDYQNDSYSYKIFNHTYEQWRSIFNITKEWFALECNVSVNNHNIGYSPAKIEFTEGLGYGQACSPEAPCNQNANLVCNSICQCKQDYVAIEVPGSYDHKCYPSVAHNESCLDDKQCERVENSYCRATDGGNGTCQCYDYYVYNGIKCYSNSTWCDWLNYDWIEQHWIDVIIILIALSTGLCLLLIVLSVSFYFRLQARKVGNKPLAFRYPSSLRPKVIVSKYFGYNDTEDKRELTSDDYLSKHQT